MTAVATIETIASDVVPTFTPSIGSGNASAAVAAARRPRMPASAVQPGGTTTGNARAVSGFIANGDQRCEVGRPRQLRAPGWYGRRFAMPSESICVPPTGGPLPGSNSCADSIRVCHRSRAATSPVYDRLVDGTRLRSAAYPVRLALVRLRAAPGRAALVALGIAAGAAMLGLAVGGSAAVRDRAVGEELARIGPSDASLQVVWSGVPAQASVSVAALDADARTALRSVVPGPGRPFGVSLFRQASFGGAFVNLGGVDGLARWVRLRSGRLPKVCGPRLCELVLVDGSGALPRLPFLRVVGRATFARDAPLRAYFGAGGERRPPLLLAEGALAVGALPLPDAELIPRTYGWVLPVAPESLHDWEIPALAHRVEAADVRLGAVDPVFSFAAPLDALESVHAKARVAG